MVEFWYIATKEFFAEKEYISTAMIQRYLKLPYFKARLILDKLIEEGFCQPQIGSYPCKINPLTN